MCVGRLEGRGYRDHVGMKRSVTVLVTACLLAAGWPLVQAASPRSQSPPDHVVTQAAVVDRFLRHLPQRAHEIR